LQDDQLDQVEYTFAGHHRGFTPGHIAAVLFQIDAIIQELRHHSIHVGFLQVYFIDRHDELHSRCFGVVYRFLGLRHNAFHRRNHDHRDIGNVCPA